MTDLLIARRLSYPAYARRLVSGFSANLNCANVNASQKLVMRRTHKREDVRGLEGDIVNLLVTFGALRVSRNHVFRDTFQLLQSERYNTLCMHAPG